MDEDKHIPRMIFTGSDRVDGIERFSHYVCRQMNFLDMNESPYLCKLAEDYLKKTKGWENNLYAYLSNEPNADSLYIDLIEELEKCTLGYFAFHWTHATLMVSQVLSANTEHNKKLRKLVMAATREDRFNRVVKGLKVKRVFNTLVEEMKAIKLYSNEDCHLNQETPTDKNRERSPVLLFMGGGMGAGKSTVLKDILKEPFWVAAANGAVVVEADAFKETDVIYRELIAMGPHDMLQTAELVHQSSTDAASSLLVTALNEGRDVIMDGTLAWVPFVEQTITMARNVHHSRYRMGVGYKVGADESITENYWEKVQTEEDEEREKKKPYRIEMVGVVCDPYLAVVRGIRRAIYIGRAVRINSQLKSHKRFASAFPGYCKLVDNARLYSTNSIGNPPKLIGHKEENGELVLDPDEFDCLRMISTLNENADSVHDIYLEKETLHRPGSIWSDVVLSSTRESLQQNLRKVIEKIEKQLENGN